MASYNELIALIDAYINQNGVQAITGQVLNGVLRAMVDQLGRGYTIMGTAVPSTDPGTPDGPESWFASTPGTYTDMGGLTVANAELALLSYTPSDGWAKTTLTQGIVSTSASVNNQVGTPSVTSSYVDGVLTFTFENIKGDTGDPAGFGAVTASVDSNIGTPSVQVQTSGPDTAKAIAFQFHNLKGETGVTSVLATVDNTSGNPQCAVSLNGQQLVLNFTGLKGAQGDTGVSADYPITIANNLTTNDPTSALSAAMGVQLESEISQLELKVDELYEKKTVVTGWVLNKYLTTNKGVGNAYDTVEHSTNGYRYVILQVTPGEKYIVNGTGGSSPRLWCFADANNIILTVSAAGASGSNNNLIVTAPANATQLIINNLNGYTEDCYKLTYGDIATLKQSVYDVALPLLSKDVSTEVSTTFSSGCINYTGGVTASNYAVHSDFVAIQSGKVYSLLTKLSSAWYVAYYTSASESDFISSQVLGDNTDTLQTKVLTIPSTAVYMRVTKDNSANSKFFQTVAEILQEKVGNTLAWLESECVVKKYYIKRDGTGDYSNLVTALTALANDESNKEIYLEGGIHDIFSQMGGQTFLDNIPSDVSSSEWPTYSLMVPNNTKIIGMGEAILKFEVPDGTSSAKMAVICPLACRKNIVVENVTIIAQNCRYCIHDETGGTFDTYTKVFRNVKLYKTGGGYSQAYGAGFSFNNNLLFDGCLFSSDNTPVWSVHDNVAYSDYANIVIKNCIFVTSSSNTTALRFATQNALSGKKSVMIENCYLGSGKILLDDSNSFPNAYALTVAKSGTPTVTNNASTNPNEPIVYE